MFPHRPLNLRVETLRKWQFLILFAISISALLLLCDSSLSGTLPPNVSHSKDDFFIKVRDGLVYLKAKGIPLDQVLTEISRVTKVKIVTLGSLRNNVTFKRRKMPLDQLLTKLIQGNADYMFIYRRPSMLAEAWIFPKEKDVEPNDDLSSYPRRRDLQSQSLEDSEEIDDPEILLSLPVQDIFKDRDAEKRIDIIETLGQLHNEQTSEILISALNDMDEDVRESAVYALGYKDNIKAVEPVAECLKDRDSWVRAAAADALAEIGDESALPYLMDALEAEKDEDAVASLHEAIDSLTH